MDKCYRYVWSNRNEVPLREVQASDVYMQEVRAFLGVESVRWKIEKREIQRIGANEV